MQFQFDRAAKAGLRTGLRAVKVESPKVMETVSLAVKDSGLIATIYPAPQVDALSPLNSVGVGGSSGGGCASE